jgi:hypothetical protein
VRVAREITGREEIEIAASREDVYAFRLDCQNLPHLNPAVRNVVRVDRGTGPLGAGSTFHCDVDLEWGECVATVHISEAVFPSLIVLDMETALRSRKDDPDFLVRSNEVARFVVGRNGGTRLVIELTLFPADSVPADELAVMEANAGAPINVELAAMKLALENRPEKMEERNVEA